MVLIEGVGRQLDPTVNIWALARPLMETWMQDNRGPEAQLRRRLGSLVEMVERLPKLIENADDLVRKWAEEGIVMHAETLAAHAARRWREVFWLIIPLWMIGAGLIGIAVALLLGR